MSISEQTLENNGQFDEIYFLEDMKKVKFIHLRTDTEKGGLTIAYRTVDGVVQYAVAKCRKTDNYCKKTGRTKACARLNSSILCHTFMGDEHEFQNAVYNLFDTGGKVEDTAASKLPFLQQLQGMGSIIS